MQCLVMPKWTKSKTIKNFYKHFRYKKSPEHPNFLTKKEHTAIIEDYFLSLIEFLIDGNIYKVPYGMGEFRVTKFKPKTKPRNFQAEIKHHKETGIWKKIPYHNFHSDGEKITIGWFTRDYPQIPNKRICRFEANQRFRKKLAASMLKQGNIQDYYKVQRNTRLHKTKVLI